MEDFTLKASHIALSHALLHASPSNWFIHPSYNGNDCETNNCNTPPPTSPSQTSSQTPSQTLSQTSSQTPSQTLSLTLSQNLSQTPSSGRTKGTERLVRFGLISANLRHRHRRHKRHHRRYHRRYHRHHHRRHHFLAGAQKALQVWLDLVQLLTLEMSV